MNMNIIDCLQLSKNICEHAAQHVIQLKKIGIIPGLAVVLVGQDFASEIYVRNKLLACKKAGIYSVEKYYSPDIKETELLTEIEILNQNPDIHGIIVQLPLPKHMDMYKITNAISVSKDVDGFHFINAGRVMMGNPYFKPCTPYGIMKILEYENIKLCGSDVTIVGSSNIVGKPIAMLLVQAGSTVTICNSRTKNLAEKTRQADILITATGKSRLINKFMIKPGAVVIDVGISRDTNGYLCGDVDFNSVKNIAGSITKVPGGVGPMTVAMLLINTVKAASISC